MAIRGGDEVSNCEQALGSAGITYRGRGERDSDPRADGGIWRPALGLHWANWKNTRNLRLEDEIGMIERLWDAQQAHRAGSLGHHTLQSPGVSETDTVNGARSKDSPSTSA